MKHLVRINFGNFIFVVFNVATSKFLMMYAVLIALLDTTMGGHMVRVPEMCCMLSYNLTVSPSLLCFQPLHLGPASFTFLGFISLKGWPRLEKKKKKASRET